MRRSNEQTSQATEPGRLLSVVDVATRLGVPKKTVYACWRPWGLPAFRVGRHLRFREGDLEAWLASRQVVVPQSRRSAR
jgi:excisionase family DNA binding protein